MLKLSRSIGSHTHVTSIDGAYESVYYIDYIELLQYES